MGFAEARTIYIEGASALYRNTGLLNKAVNTLPRHAIFGCALHIHARHAFDDDAPALTLTRLQKMTAENGGLSPGRVAAQTLLLRKLGFLETRIAADRRQRILQVTDRMVAEDHRWLTVQLRSLEAFGLFSPRDDERSPGFVLAFRAASPMMPVETAAFVGRHPAIAFFIMRDGGYSMLLELLRAWQRGGSTRVGFDVAETAAAFCVSKSQMWSLLQAAAARGLLTAAAPAWRTVCLSDRLLADFDRWFSDKAAELAEVAGRARALWAEQSAK